MFSGRGYCTEPSCFPISAAPPILVFLCKSHCRQMLCYKHWLSHRNSDEIIEDEQIEMNDSSSDSDLDENDQCLNQTKEYHRSEESSNPLSESLSDEKSHVNENTKICTKEIEWWNEITPWKNSEDFSMMLPGVLRNDDMKQNDNDEDSNSHITAKRKISKRNFPHSITCRSYIDVCPLTFDGAYGLIQVFHQHQLCLSSKNSNKRINLYQHFHSKHGFTAETSMRLVQAIVRHENPYETKLFSSTSDTPLTLYNPHHKVKCPLSTRHDFVNTPCSTHEMTRRSIRRHLLGVHQLDQQTIDKLVKDISK